LHMFRHEKIIVKNCKKSAKGQVYHRLDWNISLSNAFIQTPQNTLHRVISGLIMKEILKICQILMKRFA
jgi:hypothetical protein